MTPTKKEKDLALRGSENLNKLRIDANGMSSFFTEWVALMKEYKVPYYTHIVTELIEEGVLKRDGSKIHSGNTYSSYVFQDKPIHYTTLIPLYDKARKRGLKRKNKANDKAKAFKANVTKHRSVSDTIRDSIVKPKTFSIANHGVSITSLDENKLKDFTDAELVSELRDRGYTVTAEKVTVIKL